MAFQPVINSIAPNLILEQKKMQFAQEQMKQQQLAEALRVAGDAAAKIGQTYQKGQDLKKINAGTLAGYELAGLLTDDQKASFGKIADQKELAAALAAAGQGIEAQRRRDSSRVGQVLDVQDPLNPGQTLKFIYASDNNIVPLNQRQASKAPETITTADGILRWNSDLGDFERLMMPGTKDPAMPKAAPDPLGFLKEDEPGQGMGGMPGTVPVSQAAPPSQVISAAEASKQLGRPVQAGQRFRDRNGNVVTVQ